MELTTPTPAEIRTARADLGLTRDEAAYLIHSRAHTWKHWELGTNSMHLGLWELFLIKTGKF